ncbi:TetR/AcrR family transcriptional regulator [Streptomyces minutiscleroticus]|uniref:TetR family transcriptional regulator n=1 Tax=Streptomyces minutiscleroticus TaxID=68238 RepID=A0A918P2J1_9ACTN|nr:TetR/AcrR family transcriptional regulator [Streptomyces minutiscleroticus]GGY12334.1 TetR family transcriptional regulator [Streptomyces minutiscleroticus]
MTERRPRADAARNREAVLAAADELFASSADPRAITMADIAVAAGVGKGTLFRGFGDRTGLIRTLYAARLEPLRRAVTDGPPPLGPDTPPLERAHALLDGLLCFKFDHRHLSLALEEAAAAGPYEAEHYAWWHGTLRDVLDRLPGFAEGGGSDFAAHALLSAVRADLVDHLAGREGLDRRELRAGLGGFVTRVLGAPSSADGAGPAEDAEAPS